MSFIGDAPGVLISGQCNYNEDTAKMQHRSNVPSGSYFFYLIFDFDFRSDYMSLKSQSPNFFHHTLAVLNFQAKPASTHPAHPSG
jgi:hypothetical protein